MISFKRFNTWNVRTIFDLYIKLLELPPARKSLVEFLRGPSLKPNSTEILEICLQKKIHMVVDEKIALILFVAVHCRDMPLSANQNYVLFLVEHCWFRRMERYFPEVQRALFLRGLVAFGYKLTTKQIWWQYCFVWSLVVISLLSGKVWKSVFQRAYFYTYLVSVFLCKSGVSSVLFFNVCQGQGQGKKTIFCQVGPLAPRKISSWQMAVE